MSGEEQVIDMMKLVLEKNKFLFSFSVVLIGALSTVVFNDVALLKLMSLSLFGIEIYGLFVFRFSLFLLSIACLFFSFSIISSYDTVFYLEGVKGEDCKKVADTLSNKVWISLRMCQCTSKVANWLWLVGVFLLFILGIIFIFSMELPK